MTEFNFHQVFNIRLNIVLIQVNLLLKLLSHLIFFLNFNCEFLFKYNF